MFNKIVGNNILIVGDLHFSDVYTGKHTNYLLNCIEVMSDIVKKVKSEKPSALVLLGDIIGMTETNIRDRRNLTIFIKMLKVIQEICPIYAVQGNHDMSGYPDFLFLKELGLIITSDMCDGYFDYYANDTQEVPEVRFHLVDYGNEKKALNLHSETSNVVLGHANFVIAGVTTWYPYMQGEIELSRLTNFSGADMVISGHIHTPSPELVSTLMVDQKVCSLFYAGCPTRPTKDCTYANAWYVFFRYNEETKSTSFMPEAFPLKALSELFYDDNDFITEKTDDELQEELRKGSLKNVLDDLLTYRIQDGDYLHQIDIIQNASDEAKAIAKQYLQQELNNAV